MADFGTLLKTSNESLDLYMDGINAKSYVKINGSSILPIISDALLNSEIGNLGTNNVIVSDGGSHVNTHGSNNLLVDDIANNVSVTNSLVLPYATGSSCVSLDASKKVVSRVLTNGQLLIGSTGMTPAVSTLTPGAGISVTNAGGSITISNTSPMNANALINSSPATAPTSGALWSSNGSSNFSANVNNTLLASANTLSIANGAGNCTLNFDAINMNFTNASTYKFDNPLFSQTKLVQHVDSGNTASRPVVTTVGYMYFDTQLVPPIPIWWDGAQWVNSVGVAA